MKKLKIKNCFMGPDCGECRKKSPNGVTWCDLHAALERLKKLITEEDDSTMEETLDILDDMQHAYDVLAQDPTLETHMTRAYLGALVERMEPETALYRGKNPDLWEYADQNDEWGFIGKSPEEALRGGMEDEDGH